MIEIRAPSTLRSNGGIWDGTTWMRLDVDRVDFQVNNNVRVYEQIDEETSLNQLEASAHQLTITGHINTDSALVGSGAFTKTKNLILAGREWYVDLSAGGSGFPEIKWENLTWDFLVQKIAIIDNADDSSDTNKIFNYQLSVILAHD